MNTLTLVATRRCTQRCGYCPVVKDGWPDMSPATAIEALQWFAGRGGGKVRLFGGEPLLVPEVVRTAIDCAARDPRLVSTNLCTNAALLDESCLDWLESRPAAFLTISLDGRQEDHLRYRSPAPGQPDALMSIRRLLPRLIGFRRLIVTQVIGPDTADQAWRGFLHLMGQGFRRFNLLPAGYVRWSRPQLDSLRSSLARIAAVVKEEWAAGRALYLRNLFIRNPQPTFVNGIVVDVDGSVFPSDCVLAPLSPEQRDRLRCGSVFNAPSVSDIEARAREVPRVLAELWPAEVMQSTADASSAVDAFCRGLFLPFLDYRRCARRPSLESAVRK